MKKIFLDDVRVPENCLGYMHTRIGKLNPIYQEEWVVVRDYLQFVQAIKDHAPGISHVSFDHDLEYLIQEGTKEEDAWYLAKENPDDKTGYDCAIWLKDYYKANRFPLPVLFCHSMNPVGLERIVNLFK